MVTFTADKYVIMVMIIMTNNEAGGEKPLIIMKVTP